VDRTRSGEVGFHKNFAGRHAAPIGDANRVTLHLFLDASSVEIFVNNGERVLSDRVFPSADALGVHVDAQSAAIIKTFQIWELKSVWTERKLAANSLFAEPLGASR
jgi:fructan beta-fructosidase